MVARLERLVPLTGIVFAALGLAGMLTARVPPGVKASGEQVLAFSKQHAAGQRRADLLLILGFAFFVLFAGSLRAHLSRAPGAESAATTALVGAGVMAGGIAVYIGCDYVVNAQPDALTPAAAQALNVLALRLVFPVAVGGLVFGLAAGAAVLRSGRLPGWLGWAAVVVGLLAPIWFAQALLLYVWSVVVSIVLYRRSAPAAQQA